MGKIKYSVLIFFAALYFSFFYAHYSISRNSFQADFFENTFSQKSTGSNFIFDIDIQPREYLLKIKHLVLPGLKKGILINKKPVTPHKVKIKNSIETDWVFLEKDLVREGNNSIQVNFSALAPPEVEIRLRNFYKKIGDWFIIIFAEGVEFNKTALEFFYALFFCFIFLFLLLFISKKLLKLSYEEISCRLFLAAFPFLVFSISFIGPEILSGRHLLAFLNRDYFFVFLLIPLAIYIFILYFTFGFKLPDNYFKSISLIFVKSKDVFLNNREFFIFLLFSFFLFLSGLFAGLGLDDFSDKAIVVSYLFLISYVIMRLKAIKQDE